MNGLVEPDIERRRLGRRAVCSLLGIQQRVLELVLEVETRTACRDKRVEQEGEHEAEGPAGSDLLTRAPEAVGLDAAAVLHELVDPDDC